MVEGSWILGHVISGEGIAVDPTKVQSVTEWLAPTLVGEIRSFLGLAGYYRRFIENFSKIAKPMTELLKKDTKFKWTEECEASFQELKKCLVTVPSADSSRYTQEFPSVLRHISLGTWRCTDARWKSCFIYLMAASTS